jgi:hypothetical protein
MDTAWTMNEEKLWQNLYGDGVCKDYAFGCYTLLEISKEMHWLQQKYWI